MEVVSVEGFILNSTKYGENSKILNILTKEYGVIGVISKGCMNVKNKNRIVSENYTYATFHIYYKEGKLSTLISADVINYLSNIKSDITNISYLSYLSELVKNVYKENNDPIIYDLFINTILKIEEGFNPLVLTNILELKYLNYLGVGLNLDECVMCGSTNVVSVSHSMGGYVCARCRHDEPIMPEKMIKMMRLYYYVDISKISELNIKDDVIFNIDHFLDNYYRDYTGMYLKSKKFLENLKKVTSN